MTNLTHPSEVKALLGELGLRPRKQLGQNFLIDANILKIILAAAHIEPGDRVLEIGPGLGVLTEWLVRYADEVTAVEKDPVLLAYLHRRFAGAERLRLVHADILECDLPAFFAGGINKVAANLPFSVGTRALVGMLEGDSVPERMALTVQQEVAQRLAAGPSTADYGLLSVLAQTRYRVTLRKTIRPTCFLPAPEVQSALVQLDRREDAPELAGRWPTFRDLVKTAFSRRRKQLATLFRTVPEWQAVAPPDLLARVGLPAEVRSEQISPDQWAALFLALAPRPLPTPPRG